VKKKDNKRFCTFNINIFISFSAEEELFIYEGAERLNRIKLYNTLLRLITRG
jgi:hypothetical protein